MKRVYFVSGIDTDAGKSFATGYLARQWNESGIKTITQKFIQTGNIGRSEDIELHRRIMGVGMLPEDEQQLTMPEIFSYPASPLLASQIDKRPINFLKMESATRALTRTYDRVLLEGAGGLMVPLTENLLTIDYVASQHYPLIFVTSGRLGSINHTLLSLEAVYRRRIPVSMICYNNYPQVKDATIANDTRLYLQKYMETHFPAAQWMEIPIIDF